MRKQIAEFSYQYLEVLYLHCKSLYLSLTLITVYLQCMSYELLRADFSSKESDVHVHTHIHICTHMHICIHTLMTAVSDAGSLCSTRYRRGWGKIITWAQEPGVMHSSGDMIRHWPNLEKTVTTTHRMVENLF